jgi:hypothetical protein
MRAGGGRREGDGGTHLRSRELRAAHLQPTYRLPRQLGRVSQLPQDVTRRVSPLVAAANYCIRAKASIGAELMRGDGRRCATG